MPIQWHSLARDIAFLAAGVYPVVASCNATFQRRQIHRALQQQTGRFVPDDKRRSRSSNGSKIEKANRFVQCRYMQRRSEEHTSELQSLMRISYAVFCLQKKNKETTNSTLKYNNHT